MSSITSVLTPGFFKVGKYEYQSDHINDFSNCPRPHFCMGLIIRGSGTFFFDNKSVTVNKGDIIFVPVTSRYKSVWTGEPDSLYISMHFSAKPGGIFSPKKILEIQKISLPNFEDLKEKFEYTLENYMGSSVQKMRVLGIFYDVIGKVYEKLQYTKAEKMDKRIEKAIEFIELNYANDFTVSDLADECSMSESRLFSGFKHETGLTPIEYKHKVQINHGILLLIDNEKRSIEDISDMLGFESDTYFRRVFKKVTGMTPREYKKLNIE